MTLNHKHIYSKNSHDATLRLESFLHHKIHELGKLSFPEYMHHTLYHPDWGYYTRGSENVGKTGDFFTSVSVGSCFGIILAHRIHKLWLERGSPQNYHIIEIGANNGQLALDILNTIQKSFADLYTSISYHIIEHLDIAREAQSQMLATHSHRTHLHTNTTQLVQKQGVQKQGFILSNELIDAFPVHLLQLQNGKWHEKNVTLTDGKLDFTLSEPLTPELEHFTSKLPKNLPDNYQTEYRSGLAKHLTEIGEMLESFHTITIDYGHTHSSYYTASRSTGTLRCYHQHQADDEPLLLPGLKDITAHVDFTQLATAYLENGHALTEFSSQSHYLITHAREWLLELEKKPHPENFKLIRQFQTLTHPTTMGHQFHVLETFSEGPSCVLALEKLEIPPAMH